MAVAHLHNGPFMQPDESKAAVLEHKTIIAPDLREIGRAGFRPFGVVIAGNDVAGNAQAIEKFLGQAKLLARAVLGDISRDNHEAQTSDGINIAYSRPQILFTGGGADMCIAEPRKTKRVGLSA